MRLHATYVIRSLDVKLKSEEDWQRPNVFITYIKINNKHLKLMIDGGTCTNLVAKSAIEKMGLKAETYP